jgi:hypothetical protein
MCEHLVSHEFWKERFEIPDVSTNNLAKWQRRSESVRYFLFVKSIRQQCDIMAFGQGFDCVKSNPFSSTQDAKEGMNH